MVDIIDIMLAKAITPEGAADGAAATAKRYAREASDSAQTATEAASAAAASAEEAAGVVTDMTSAIDTEVKKLILSLTSSAISNGTSYNLVTTYPDNTIQTLQNLIKIYNTTGSNTDGAMTQKAITDALNTLDQKIEEHGGSGGISNLGSENAGKIVVVGDDGNITAGTTTESEIIEALISSGVYTAKDAVGIEIDYVNKTFSRIQLAAGRTSGQNFDEFTMYGGRKRCNVADNGSISAWYGENNYKEDGSNGQVMVYQPKFYYTRVPITTEGHYNGGEIIRKEILIITATKQAGFKIHPMFVSPEGEELDYVFISAYEGCAYNNSTHQYDVEDGSTINFNYDKLSSIGGAKPISGVNKELTIGNAEKLATNRGAGWHITNLAFESMMQMLETIEFGTLNGQAALEAGLVNLTNNGSYNCSSLTGSTASLGNVTGAAAETINTIGSSTNTYSNAGRRAISYRGVENPWGNIWRMIGGLNIVGNSGGNGGKPYICKDFNYTPSSIDSNYEDVGFYLPATFDWISGFGYGNEKYDWVFIPIECSNGNSAVPVGDNLWTTANLNSINMALSGGVWSYGDSCGPFYYAFDKSPNSATRAYSARLMFIPQKNSVYTTNITKWTNAGGR